MRIAIFGGSFNPPHNGHVRAVLAAKPALKADRLLIVQMQSRSQGAGGKLPLRTGAA